MRSTSRRQFLVDALGATTALGCGGWASPTVAGVVGRLAPSPSRSLEGGRRLGTVPFRGEDRIPFGRPLGSGLGGRLWTDLSQLSPEDAIVPNNRFYIRTRCPTSIDDGRPWTIEVGGAVETTGQIAADELERRAMPMGAHLLECSGNGGSFGLMSVAEWSGVPISPLVEHARPRSGSHRVLIEGFDEHEGVDPDSIEAGASWIFTQEQLETTGAFLAVGMNGETLPRDHGRPVRLVVPGWYGCTCIKWVNRIELVPETAKATRHMREFAGRTHQRGVPRRAADFRAAEIDLTATPTRIEKWNVDGRIVYRVIGLLWGGSKTTDALEIRFNRDEEYSAVESCDHPSNQTWSFWSHTWRPASRGRYRIQLRVNDPSIRTRRLDRGYYTREVRIRET